MSGAVFVVGQRWASHADPDLGLGIITEVAWRRVNVSWPAVGETRTYATDGAPLSRIRFNPRDMVRDMDGHDYRVRAVSEHGGLLTYHCSDAQGAEIDLSELDLDCFVRLTSPRQRLFSGQFDRNSLFDLRLRTLAQHERLQHSPLRGLLGARGSLLPHQVHIATEVARRQAPRVLLADEVGLGKTIEAGMILHQQVLTGQAERVLILVPDSLVHQWLVEMLRRFNLLFAVFDRSRLQALAESDAGNPFETEQLVICALDLLVSDAEVADQVRAAGWDLVVVDEAHHLHWSRAESSPEYDRVAELAAATPGLLLLTATPEQAGIEGHFARLRLIDPARFHDLESFRREEAGYAALNRLVGALLEGEGADPEQLALLRERLGDSVEARLAEPAGRDSVIRELLDRHGTGRVLFRNTRDAVGGFPERELAPAPLSLTEHYAEARRQAGASDPLYPEAGMDDAVWTELDPRVAWLSETLKARRSDKVLVICHRAETAIALDKHLNLRAGVRCTLFHEGLSLLERDRAAAWFADTEGGAQVLVCSEIGSEGRNFQFAHQLVLFDLPPNPDLVEQRIGRLDRIGQQHRIQLHLPYLEGTGQAVLFRWYHEGLNLFARPFSAGFAVYERFAERLQAQIAGTGADLSALVADTAAEAEAIRQRLQAGRDRLLELNSCDPERAAGLIEMIEAEEGVSTLEDYMARVFDEFGVDQEFHSDRSLILRPGNHMLTDHFPGLDPEGVTVTFSRARALAREDMAFLSWEHPMVAETMAMILNEGLGNAAVATISVQGLPAGTLLIETCFTPAVSAPRRLRLEAFLPASPQRYLHESSGRDLSAMVSSERLGELCQPVKKKIAQSIVERVREPVEKILSAAQEAADRELPAIKRAALGGVEHDLGGELRRLEALREVNPNIRVDELEALRERIESVSAAIDRTRMQLQALRIVVNS